MDRNNCPTATTLFALRYLDIKSASLLDVLSPMDLSSTVSELTQLSGVAAILRFPIADLSEAEDDSSSDED